MKERVYSVEDIINNKGGYETCILEDDYTLSFDYDDWRGGGNILSKDFYKEKTYFKAIQKHLAYLKDNNPEYYKKIRKMLHKNFTNITKQYYKTIKKTEKPKIKIINGRKYYDICKDSLKTIQFSKQVIERLRYEIHDLSWKKEIDKALKRIEEDEKQIINETGKI